MKKTNSEVLDRNSWALTIEQALTGPAEDQRRYPWVESPDHVSIYMQVYLSHATEA